MFLNVNHMINIGWNLYIVNHLVLHDQPILLYTFQKYVVLVMIYKKLRKPNRLISLEKKYYFDKTDS